MIGQSCDCHCRWLGRVGDGIGFCLFAIFLYFGSTLVAGAAESVRPWVESFAAELSGGDPAGYVNFLSDEGPARVRAAYPGDAWHRLVAVKRRLDPDNLFHRNQNIPPDGDLA